MMLSLLEAELRKLRGSLVLLLIGVPPLLPGLLIGLAMATNDSPPAWSSLLDRLTLPLWAMFLNPTLLATLATLMGEIEYRTNGWAFTLTQPFTRWQIFLAKFLVFLAMHALMIAIAVAFAAGVGSMVGSALDRGPTGALPYAELARFVGLMVAGSLGILALQLWIALRYRNFVLPLALGIGGTLVSLAVLLASTNDADWFPWVVAMRSGLGEQAMGFALTGLAMGVTIALAMILDLQRRAFR